MLKKIMLCGCTAVVFFSTPAFSWVTFEQACTLQDAHVKSSNRINSINAIPIADGFKTTVSLDDKEYVIHRDNPYVFELAKAAYLIRARVASCVRENSAGLKEIVGIELTTKRSHY